MEVWFVGWVVGWMGGWINGSIDGWLVEGLPRLGKPANLVKMLLYISAADGRAVARPY